MSILEEVEEEEVGDVGLRKDDMRCCSHGLMRVWLIVQKMGDTERDQNLNKKVSVCFCPVTRVRFRTTDATPCPPHCLSRCLLFDLCIVLYCS